MSEHVVAKPFKTVNRKMKAGAPVAEDDHLEPHNFADLKKNGFIEEKGAAKAEPDTKPSESIGLLKSWGPKS